MKNLVTALCLSTAVALAALPASADKSLSKSDVEAIVKQYIADHPDAVIDALKKYQEKQQAEQMKKSREALKNGSADLTNDKHSPVAGNPKGDVTVVEFFDYHCHYCKNMLPVVSNLIKDDPKVRVVFKEFPILSPESETAARAALAFYKLQPEKYFEYHTALMNINGRFDEGKLLDEAEKLGANRDEMKKEMHSAWVDDELKKNKKLAQELYIRGTPGFIIGDKMIPGAASPEDMKKAIADARGGKKAKAAPEKKDDDKGDDSDKDSNQGT